MRNRAGTSAAARAALVLALLLGGSLAQAEETGTTARYFPLQPQTRWLLAEPSTGRQVTVSVVSSDGLTSRVRTRTPWSLTDWVATDRTARYDLSAYGNFLALLPLPENPALYRFDAPAGTSWTNELGTFTVTDRGFVLQAGTQSYSDCLSIRQVSPGFSATITFAPGTGIVRYSIGGSDFDLDQARSVLPVFPSTSSGPLPPLGVLPNPTAGITDTEEAANARLATLSNAGMSFILSYGSWPRLEPAPGHFNLGSLRYHQSVVSSRGWQSGYTLTIINMDRREVPDELQQEPWNSPQMEARVLALIDALAAEFQGRMDYFQFGNEADTYFASHPGEIQAFLELFTAARNRLKELSPETAVSITFKHSSLDQLATIYQGLDEACDLLAVTYGPYTETFDAKPPSTVTPDFAAIRAAARGRKILFQEIAYPSATANASTPEQQARFYQALLDELRGANGQVAAAQIFLLSEMDESQARAFTSGLGLAAGNKLDALLGSLGLFDANLEPKPAWSVITAETAP